LKASERRKLKKRKKNTEKKLKLNPKFGEHSNWKKSMWLYLCLHEIRLYSTLSPGIFPHYSSKFVFKRKKSRNTYVYFYIYL